MRKRIRKNRSRGKASRGSRIKRFRHGGNVHMNTPQPKYRFKPSQHCGFSYGEMFETHWGEYYSTGGPSCTTSNDCPGCSNCHDGCCGCSYDNFQAGGSGNQVCCWGDEDDRDNAPMNTPRRTGGIPSTNIQCQTWNGDVGRNCTAKPIGGGAVYGEFERWLLEMSMCHSSAAVDEWGNGV